MNQYVNLIPKIRPPSPHHSDWRPISLCNISYKILPKIFSPRLKNILLDLLNPCQGAFTQGRDTLDNAFVVLEIIHSILAKDKRIKNGNPM